jgi:ubiquinone/menaquinone biosynthesis C-methylase UbiE
MNSWQKIKSFFRQIAEKNPENAYDLWSALYDAQPGNPVLDLDELLFSNLLNETDISGKTIVDMGCGTGRHWSKLYAQHPARLIGYDVSAGMLEKLKEKYPEAETYHLINELLPDTATAFCDVIVSTLALAHIPVIENAVQEWNRVLKPGGHIIITDYHPDTLAKGGKRTFKAAGKTIAVKSYVYPLAFVRQLAGQLGWKEIRFMQREIDEQVKRYYTQQDALRLYETFKGTPLIYGIHFSKV